MPSTDAEREGGAGTSEDQAYFRAIEEVFLRLRGSGTLLSAADWQLARGWRRAGIPIETVISTMETLFERQRQRKSKRGISSLRYFRAAVAAAWDEEQERRAGGPRIPTEPPLDVGDRLQRLARALPDGLPGRERLAAAIVGLSGGVEEVEPRLAELGGEVSRELRSSLSADERIALEAELDRALASFAHRLSASERETARSRLREQALRRRWRLPLLSLFAQEAQDPGGD